jgi:hypothetical protein
LVGSSGLTGSSWFGLWYATGVKPGCMVLGFAIGVRPVSFDPFGYRGEACELCLVLVTGVGPVSWWP